MKKVLASGAGLLGSSVVALVLISGVGADEVNSTDSVSDEITEFAPWCDGQVDYTVYGCTVAFP